MNLTFSIGAQILLRYVFKVISGSQDLSRKLSRVNGILLGLGKNQNDRCVPEKIDSYSMWLRKGYLSNLGLLQEHLNKVPHRNASELHYLAVQTPPH